MSWFSELAGRAEALLDKMDQAAATSLQATGVTGRQSVPQSDSTYLHAPVSSQSFSGSTGPAYEPTAQPDTRSSLSFHDGSSSHPGTRPPPTGLKFTSYTSQRNATTEHSSSPPSPSSVSSSSSSFKRQPAPSDESLFDFLNSPSKSVSLNASQSSGKREAGLKSQSATRPQPVAPQPGVHHTGGGGGGGGGSWVGLGRLETGLGVGGESSSSLDGVREREGECLKYCLFLVD